jgi:hypothetical protein
MVANTIQMLPLLCNFPAACCTMFLFYNKGDDQKRRWPFAIG